MVTWTPPFSQRAIGTVMAKRRPLKPVMPLTYQSMLEDRIQTLVDRMDPMEAELALAELALRDGLAPIDLPTAGRTLVRESQILRELAAMPMEPIAPREWANDPEAESALETETLTDYLDQLRMPMER